MTKRIIHMFRQARLSLAFGGLVGWTAMVALHSCTKTSVETGGQDSTYFGRLSFVIKDNTSFSQYYAALQQTGLLDTLSSAGPYTVLLPNNDAYKAGYLAYAPQNGDLNSWIWSIGKPNLSVYTSYSIVRGKWACKSLPLGDNQELTTITGSKVYVSRYLSGKDTVTTVNGLKVISLDNPATNGLLDVISDAVPNPEIYPTVLQTLQSDSNYAFFMAALHRTHLDTLLSGKEPYTVLAPSNFAFNSKLSYGVRVGLNVGMNLFSIDSILTADVDRLSQVVKYHILPGRYFLNDILRRQIKDTLLLPTVSGESVRFFAQNGGSSLFPKASMSLQFFGSGNQRASDPYVWSALPYYLNYYATTITCVTDYSNRPAGNGVVHLLDNVLIPNSSIE